MRTDPDDSLVDNPLYTQFEDAFDEDIAPDPDPDPDPDPVVHVVTQPGPPSADPATLALQAFSKLTAMRNEIKAEYDMLTDGEVEAILEKMQAGGPQYIGAYKEAGVHKQLANEKLGEKLKNGTYNPAKAEKPNTEPPQTGGRTRNFGGGGMSAQKATFLKEFGEHLGKDTEKYARLLGNDK